MNLPNANDATGANVNAHGHHRYLQLRAKNKTLKTMVWLAIISGPVMTIPQIYAIWSSKTPGVSIATWTAYLFVNGIWFIYAKAHKEKALLISQAVWILLDTAIVLGLLLNR